MNEKDFTVSKIIDFFPSSMRDNVQYQIDMFSLKDAVKAAKNDTDKITALNNLAFFNKEQEQKRSIYLDILKTFPNRPEAVDAYHYFLLRKDSSNTVSIKMYQEFAKQCPELKQLTIWQKGWRKLKTQPESVQYDYLLGLLGIEPHYREYHDLYKELYYQAIKKKDDAVSGKAKVKMNETLNHPTMRSVLDKIMMEQEKKREKKK